VSCERVLSGPGIKNIYDFLGDTKKAEEPELHRRQHRRKNRAADERSHLYAVVPGQRPHEELASGRSSEDCCGRDSRRIHAVRAVSNGESAAAEASFRT
jgi:hypothetical protein